MLGVALSSNRRPTEFGSGNHAAEFNLRVYTDTTRNDIRALPMRPIKYIRTTSRTCKYSQLGSIRHTST